MGFLFHSVIGLSDGLTVPFALTAGLAGLGNSRVVVLGGVAELVAGAISMGCGAFCECLLTTPLLRTYAAVFNKTTAGQRIGTLILLLYSDARPLVATQAERDQYLYLTSQTSSRILQSCSGEIEREVDDILGPLGVPEELSKKVAEALRKEEIEFSPLAHHGRHSDEEDDSSNLRWSEEVGLTPFLLRLGKGIEPVAKRRMYSSAATIGLGYLAGGLIPLMPYFFIQPASTALIYSSILTGMTLIAFGAIKTHIVGCSGKFTDYLYGALTTLLVGGLSAAAAFGFVKLLEGRE